MKTPGRPRKSLLDRRAASVTVRLRLDEAMRLEHDAGEAGLTASELIRLRALAERPAAGISVELKHDLYRLLLAVQRGIKDGLPADALTERMRAVTERLYQ